MNLANNSTNSADWIKKAQEDEFAGKEILEAGRFFAPACFHFQQMAEKYLKALLVYLAVPFPKVHDLIELETLIAKKVPEISQLHDDLKILNRYYIETRYPGDYPEFSRVEAQAAYLAALRIKKFILARIR